MGPGSTIAIVVGCTVALGVLARVVAKRFGFKILYLLYRSPLGLLLHAREVRKAHSRKDGEKPGKGLHSVPLLFVRPDVEVLTIPILADNLCYVVIDPVSRCAACVDPADALTVLEFAQQLKITITHILTTHGHWDHAGGNRTLKRHLPGVEVVGTRADSLLCGITKFVTDGDEFRVGALQVTVVASPCHTRGHVIYEVEPASLSPSDPPPSVPSFIHSSSLRSSPVDKYSSNSSTASNQRRFLSNSSSNSKQALVDGCCEILYGDISAPPPLLLFTGDTLFVAGAGHFFEGSSREMLSILRRLLPLPPSTLVFCGHEYTHKNLQFALTLEPHNPALCAKIEKVALLRKGRLPTVPSTWEEELGCNPYLRVTKGELYALRSLPTAQALDTLNAKKKEFALEYANPDAEDSE